MRATIESTDCIAMVLIDGRMVLGRLWNGRSESGVEFTAFITRLAVATDQDTAEFERELCTMVPPNEATLHAFALVDSLVRESDGHA